MEGSLFLQIIPNSMTVTLICVYWRCDNFLEYKELDAVVNDDCEEEGQVWLQETKPAYHNKHTTLWCQWCLWGVTFVTGKKLKTHNHSYEKWPCAEQCQRGRNSITECLGHTRFSLQHLQKIWEGKISTTIALQWKIKIFHESPGYHRHLHIKSMVRQWCKLAECWYTH